MKNKQKTPDSGAQYAGTPPIQHPEVVLGQQREAGAKTPVKKAAGGTKRAYPDKHAKSINEDDIEADRHNGSGGAFEATEAQRDEE